MNTLPFINDTFIKDKISVPTAIRLVAQAFLDYHNDIAKMPPKTYLDLPEFNGDFRAMPAYNSKSQFACLKWVNSHSNNKELPSVMATLILNDAKTGEPLATLEARQLTALRTGAAAGVATNCLANKDAQTLALIGAGEQAYYQALAIHTVRPLSQINIVDLDSTKATALSERLKNEITAKIQCSPCQTAVENAQIIATTTPSKIPIIMANWIQPGTHINAMGADAPGKQELDPKLLKKNLLIVDDLYQAKGSGEINVPLQNSDITESDINANLGAIIANDKPGRNTETDITIFDSTGLAVQDLALAEYAYQKYQSEH